MTDDTRKPKRKRPAHYVLDSTSRPTLVFLTVCTHQRRRLLADPKMHALLLDVWTTATAWAVGRYVVMPDHVHLFVAPGMPELPLTNWVSFWKRAFTKRFGTPVWQQDYWDTTLRSAEHASD